MSNLLAAIAIVVAILVPPNYQIRQKSFDDVSTAEPVSELVQSSRRAIIETGFSESYFDEHFRIGATFDNPGDIRIVWMFSLNGYEASVTDAIGYYTDRQQRIYVHSVKNTLGSTRDITKTIRKQRAEALMKACLGRYAGEAVALMRLSPTERASLYLTAHSIIRRMESSDRRERKAKPEKRDPRHNQESDVIENEGNERRPPIYLGYINLETGKCSEGRANATP